MKRQLKSSWKNEKHTMTIREQVIYINLVTGCFDRTEATNISVETLSRRTGYSKKAIEGILQSLEENGFIKIRGEWKIIVKPETFEFFTTGVLGLVDPTSTVVAFRMASLRDRKSSWVRMSDNAIFSTISIGKPTFRKAKKNLLEAGIIRRVDDSYQLDTEYFPIIEETISLEMKERSNALLASKDKPGEVYRYYYTRDFKDLKMNPDTFIMYCEAGCPGLKYNWKGFTEDEYRIPTEFSVEF